MDAALELVSRVVGLQPINLGHIEVTFVQEFFPRDLRVIGRIAIGTQRHGDVGESRAQPVHEFGRRGGFAGILILYFGVDYIAIQVQRLQAFNGFIGLADGIITLNIVPAPTLDLAIP